ncbi:R-spondin-2 [Merluccius polli]|uniref:R-spondin-2 n=1 Tax=Merluccius polli TaxID=89951 RepID=A0AA47NYR4_MERPO|nr:R-spondin-2 [Merluccius polli]
MSHLSLMLETPSRPAQTGEKEKKKPEDTNNTATSRTNHTAVQMQFRLFSFALIVLNCMEYSSCQAPSHRWRRNKRGSCDSFIYSSSGTNRGERSASFRGVKFQTLSWHRGFHVIRPPAPHRLVLPERSVLLSVHSVLAAMRRGVFSLRDRAGASRESEERAPHYLTSKRLGGSVLFCAGGFCEEAEGGSGSELVSSSKPSLWDRPVLWWRRLRFTGERKVEVKLARPPAASLREVHGMDAPKAEAAWEAVRPALYYYYYYYCCLSQLSEALWCEEALRSAEAADTKIEEKKERDGEEV